MYYDCCGHYSVIISWICLFTFRSRQQPASSARIKNKKYHQTIQRKDMVGKWSTKKHEKAARRRSSSTAGMSFVVCLPFLHSRFGEEKGRRDSEGCELCNRFRHLLLHFLRVNFNNNSGEIERDSLQPVGPKSLRQFRTYISPLDIARQHNI